MAVKKTVKDSPAFFKEYCPKPYDQNIYTVYMENGSKFPFTDYIHMRNFWFKCVQQGISESLVRVEVVDKEQKASAGKGF